MNILFIGPYRQSDSWGNLSRSLLKSLSLIDDISITCRPVFLSNLPEQKNLDPSIFSFEANKKEKYDVLIQHMLPNYMLYNSNFETVIGVSSFETRRNRQWDNYLMLLDKVFVSTEAEKSGISEEIKNKVHVIGGAVEVDELAKNNGNRFTFYTIAGGLETLAGTKNIIQAYCSEFHMNDNVTLVLQAEDSQKADAMIAESLREIGVYNAGYYPHIHVVQGLDGLHEGCNCYIDASFSTGFSHHVATALLSGNPPVVIRGSGRDEFVTNENGFIVDSYEDILIYPDRPLADMFTARETCFKPNLLSLKSTLRSCFENKLEFTKKSRKGPESKESLSHAKQASVIKEILCS
jgi:hypothetical protein